MSNVTGSFKTKGFRVTGAYIAGVIGFDTY